MTSGRPDDAAGSADTRSRLRRRLRAAAIGLAAAAVLLAAREALIWPDVTRLATQDPTTTAFIRRHEASERAAGRVPAVEWAPVPRARIARSLQLAVLVAEDDRFFSHGGFAVEEMKDALRDAVREGRAPRGASTITQQLAKNLWLSPSRSPVRKARETMLTWQLERRLEKGRILELYLNVAEFGPGVYGAEAAARHYFGVGAAALSEAQAAELAAALPRPSTWHPGIGSAGYRRRVALIRDRMRRWPWVLPG